MIFFFNFCKNSKYAIGCLGDLINVKFKRKIMKNKQHWNIL